MYYFHRETHTMLRAAILLVVLFISSSSIPNLTIGFGGLRCLLVFLWGGSRLSGSLPGLRIRDLLVHTGIP